MFVRSVYHHEQATGPSQAKLQCSYGLFNQVYCFDALPSLSCITFRGFKVIQEVSYSFVEPAEVVVLLPLFLPLRSSLRQQIRIHFTVSQGVIPELFVSFAQYKLGHWWFTLQPISTSSSEAVGCSSHVSHQELFWRNKKKSTLYKYQWEKFIKK
jgi:hypothetical protein